MKLQDKETLSIAAAVSDVLERKTVKEINYPHKMYSPDGKEVTATNKEEHEKYSKEGYSHTKPVKEVDEPQAKGEKDFKAKHVTKKSGAQTDGTVTKESVQIDEKLSAADYKKAQAIVNDPKTKGGNHTQAMKDLEKWKKGSTKDKKVQDMLRIAHESVEEQDQDELSPKQKAYQAFFKKALKKFGVKSPSELESDEKRKEFFDYIDKNYDAEGEKAEEVQKEEVTITIDTAILEAKKPGKGKTTLDIDYIGDPKHAKTAEKRHKIKIKVTGRSTADITGEKKNIVAYMKDPDLYGMDDADIEDVYPQLYK